MTASREWIQREGLATGEPWHLRGTPTPPRWLRKTVSACGIIFLGSVVVTVWDGEGPPPGRDRCPVCAHAHEALAAMED
jgi:hypothetical protein